MATHAKLTTAEAAPDFKGLIAKASAAREATHAAYEALLSLGAALEDAKAQGLPARFEEMAFRGRKGAAEALNKSGAVFDLLQQAEIRAGADLK